MQPDRLFRWHLDCAVLSMEEELIAKIPIFNFWRFLAGWVGAGLLIWAVGAYVFRDKS